VNKERDRHTHTRTPVSQIELHTIPEHKSAFSRTTAGHVDCDDCESAENTFARAFQEQSADTWPDVFIGIERWRTVIKLFPRFHTARKDCANDVVLQLLEPLVTLSTTSLVQHIKSDTHTYTRIRTHTRAREKIARMMLSFNCLSHFLFQYHIPGETHQIRHTHTHV
jgi:hypothetical protein